MKKLLVPVDGSRNSLRALKYAASQARGGVLHLINVEPPLDNYGMVRAYITPREHEKAMKARAAGVLKRAAASLGGSRAKCVTHAVIGDPAEAIAAAARRLRCESIVIPSSSKAQGAELKAYCVRRIA
jgi:nucleotide-binding universal stress UspA family protein